jgi:hypothetical protein
MVYLPYWWRNRPSLALLARTTGEPEGLMPGVRRAVRSLDAHIAIGDAEPLERIMTASVAGRRYQTRLLLAFGGVALFIATLGVYAVTSYSVSRRRREMNIRVALGAQPARVLVMVLRQGTVPIRERRVLAESGVRCACSGQPGNARARGDSSAGGGPACCGPLEAPARPGGVGHVGFLDHPNAKRGTLNNRNYPKRDEGEPSASIARGVCILLPSAMIFMRRCGANSAMSHSYRSATFGSTPAARRDGT